MIKSVLRHMLPAAFACSAFLGSALAAEPLQLITREEAGVPTFATVFAAALNVYSSDLDAIALSAALSDAVKQLPR